MILRYQCFKTVEDYKKSVLKLLPNKIDIGPIYSISVCVVLKSLFI
jgi:DNA primase catalytic subunit